jgi:2,4-diketo-3-deoxy-L-fuconate hydrolase
MKIARLGDFGNERPAVFVDGSHVVFVDHVIEDWSRKELELGALEKVQSLDLSSLEKFLAADFRIGAPISNPTKIVCIGLNYARHARETGVEPPREPVVFMKAPDTLVGPNDDILIPPGSTKTDYEVELAVVIGSRALYLKSPEESPKHILGFSISQEASHSLRSTRWGHKLSPATS